MTEDTRSETIIQPYMPFREFVKRLLAIGTLGITIIALWQLRDVILLSFLAVIIAISLDIPVRRLQNRGLKRGWSMLLVTIITITGFILVGVIIGTPLVVQTQRLIEDLPAAIDRLSNEYAEMSQEYAFLPDVDFESNEINTDESLGVISADTVSEGASLVTSIGASMLSIVVNLSIVIIVALYLLAEPETYANSFLSLIPQSSQVRILKIMIDLRASLVSWLVTQLISMIIIGSLITFSLGVIWGIPNAIALGMMAGLLTFIPNFGSIIAAIPAIIFTLADRPTYILPVILTYVVVQQIESNFITPMIVKRRLSIPAAALLIFQVVAGVLFGFLGLLLAVPMFMVIKELVRELYVDDVLNNINIAIESRSTAEGETVVRVTGSNYATDEIPLKSIFRGTDLLDQKLKEMLPDDWVETETD